MTKEHFKEDISVIFGIVDDSLSMEFKNNQDELIIGPKDDDNILTEKRFICLNKIPSINNVNKIIIKNIEFKNIISFSKTKNAENQKLIFQDCTFDEGLRLDENSFINYEFLKCDFKELFPFSKNQDLYFDVKFDECTFNNKSVNNLKFNTLEIDNCKFDNSFIEITGCDFRELVIFNSIFKNKLEFRNCNFKEKVNLINTKEINFSKLKFDIEFDFNDFNSVGKNIKIDFDSCEFNKPINGCEYQEIQNEFGFL